VRENGRFPRSKPQVEYAVPELTQIDKQVFNLDLDRKNKVQAFSDIGMINPFAKSMKKEFKAA